MDCSYFLTSVQHFELSILYSSMRQCGGRSKAQSWSTWSACGRLFECSLSEGLLKYASPAVSCQQEMSCSSMSSAFLLCSVQAHSYSLNITVQMEQKILSFFYQLENHVGGFCSLLWELLNHFICHWIKCQSSFSPSSSPEKSYKESKYKCVCFRGRQKGLGTAF